MDGHAADEDVTMAEWVKRLRDHAGMTQQKFAGELGISLSTVARWETTEMRPRGLALGALARFAKRKGFTEPMPQ